MADQVAFDSLRGELREEKEYAVEWLCRSCHVEEHRKDHQR
jgi:hypothetical protein